MILTKSIPMPAGFGVWESHSEAWLALKTDYLDLRSK